MFAIIAIIALVIAAVIVVSILGAALHFLFSPLVLVAIIAVLAWMKFGPRRSRQ